MYINDLDDKIDSQLFMFADDTKVLRILCNAAYDKEI